MSASGKKAFEPLFEPKVPGFAKAKLNDLASVEQLITDETVAGLHLDALKSGLAAEGIAAEAIIRDDLMGARPNYGWLAEESDAVDGVGAGWGSVGWARLLLCFPGFDVIVFIFVAFTRRLRTAPLQLLSVPETRERPQLRLPRHLLHDTEK